MGQAKRRGTYEARKAVAVTQRQRANEREMLLSFERTRKNEHRHPLYSLLYAR